MGNLSGRNLPVKQTAKMQAQDQRKFKWIYSSGKQKQLKVGEKRIAKKLNFEEYQERNKKRKNSKGDNGQKP